MRFKRLTIEGYKSFQNATEIVFPETTDGRTIFLIGGMNGAGKTSLMEAINICLYGAKQDLIYRGINRQEMASGNPHAAFELVLETDDLAEIVVQRSWSAAAVNRPRAKDLQEKLVVVRDGKRVSVQDKQRWHDYIRALVPPGITQFFFFDGEKIQEIAADEHSEVRLRRSLEAALGIQLIKRLSEDITYIKNQEQKEFVETSNADLEFEQSRLKKEQEKLKRKQQDREAAQQDLVGFRQQLNEARKRFQATFQMEPETRNQVRESEKKRVQASNRLGQVENQIKGICEKYLPLALAGKFFGAIREQIEAERESLHQEAIRENAETLAKEIVNAVEEPEPIYPERLSDDRVAELERRILRVLRQGAGLGVTPKILNLSEREAERVLHRIEEIEDGNIYLLGQLLEEKQELESEIRRLDTAFQIGVSSDTERELFDQLQAEMESCSTQIGRKTEQIRLLDDEVLRLEKRVRDIDGGISNLLDRYNVSKEKAGFIAECDAIAKLLGQFIERLRENKVHLLQEKTFEMYRRLSSKGGLVKALLINDQTYEVSLQDRSGHEIKKSGLSAGEKEVFAVSLLWGLAQTSQLRLPIIIDTPLSRLDSSHRSSIITNYFPNAGEQVVILSTDTEVDADYYAQLKPYLAGAGVLEFDQARERTIFRPGYFWEH